MSKKVKKWKQFKKIRSVLTFGLGFTGIINEGFLARPQMDRPGLLITYLALMGYPVTRWLDGRRDA